MLGKPVENILEAQKKIACLEQKFPACRFETEKTENSLSVLVNVSSYFQIRLFIQKQTKLSFFEKSSSGFEKIADAKLPSEPFSQLEHFIQHFPEYEVEFSRLSEKCALQDKKTGKPNTLYLKPVKQDLTQYYPSVINPITNQTPWYQSNQLRLNHPLITHKIINPKPTK